MKRNYGIDALRILSMFMVVVLHVLSQGGVLAATEPGSFKYYIVWFLEIACYCATNCFALISGYVMYRSKAKISKLVSLWLQVAFYTIPALVIFGIFTPESISLGTILDGIFPVGRRHYWYISSYFGLMFLMPLLNLAIANVSKRMFATVLAVVFFFFSIFTRITMTDPFTLGSGYSVIWLVLLYLLGAYIHKYGVEEKISKVWAWVMIIAPILFTFLFKTACEIFPQNIYPMEQFGRAFLSYTSPTMVLTAVGLLIVLSKQNFGKLSTRLIALCAPASLGVYLIHTNALVWEHLLKGFSVSFANQNWFVMLFLILCSAVLIYLVCTGIEILRILLFELIRVEKLCRKLDDLLEKLYNKYLPV